MFFSGHHHFAVVKVGLMEERTIHLLTLLAVVIKILLFVFLTVLKLFKLEGYLRLSAVRLVKL
nr:hypothetical protein BCU26_13460 [Vibrio splendidus]